MGNPVFEKNITAFRSRFPEAAVFLANSWSDTDLIPEDAAISAGVSDVCGKTVLCAEKDGLTYQLDSLYDSEELLNVWFKTLDHDKGTETKLIMYGLGNGMFARKFLKTVDGNCSIVVHEPSAKIVRTVLENFDLSDIIADPRFEFVLWPLYFKNEDLKVFYGSVIEYREIKLLKTAFYTNYPRIFENDCLEFLSGIEGARDLVAANQLVHDRFGGDYSRNTFNNIKYIPESLSYEDLINEMPEDIPAIVIAAGPSLDKNIGELKAAKGKCLMISTDTALKPLALAGITPDVSIVFDGKKDARYLSEESSRYVPMLCTPRSGDTFMNLHKGVKIFTDSFCDHIRKFMDDEGCMFVPISTGGSVANYCFGLAESLHCKRIILVGQDLAYTGDKTHSAVTVRGSVETAVEDLENPVMGIDINGDPIRTSLEFKVYKEWFESEISHHPDLNVIDATEGGIRIEGTTLMTLKDAIEKECTKEFDFQKVLSKVGKLLSGDKKQKFIDYAGLIPQQMRDLRRLINVSLADYSTMRKLIQTNRYNTSEFRKLYTECADNSEKIENSPVIEYVHNQLQDRSSEMLNNINKHEQDEKSELLAVCDIAEKYLNDMLEAISELTPYIEAMKVDLCRINLSV